MLTFQKRVEGAGRGHTHTVPLVSTGSVCLPDPPLILTPRVLPLDSHQAFQQTRQCSHRLGPGTPCAEGQQARGVLVLPGRVCRDTVGRGSLETAPVSPGKWEGLCLSPSCLVCSLYWELKPGCAHQTISPHLYLETAS